MRYSMWTSSKLNILFSCPLFPLELLIKLVRSSSRFHDIKYRWSWATAAEKNQLFGRLKPLVVALLSKRFYIGDSLQFTFILKVPSKSNKSKMVAFILSWEEKLTWQNWVALALQHLAIELKHSFGKNAILHEIHDSEFSVMRKLYRS